MQFNYNLKIPPTAKIVTIESNFQSILAALDERSPKKPINDLAAIINREVPTAIFMGESFVPPKPSR